MNERKNINRGYMKLIVWQDARAFYVVTCKIFRAFQYELKRVAFQQIASVDSIHRNIAEGYCRRSLKESLQFLTGERLETTDRKPAGKAGNWRMGGKLCRARVE